jgi:hypothetical protein
MTNQPKEAKEPPKVDVKESKSKQQKITVQLNGSEKKKIIIPSNFATEPVREKEEERHPPKLVESKLD